MTKKLFTSEEFQEFVRLTRKATSSNQIDRIVARMTLAKLSAVYGKAKCNAIWIEIQAGEKTK